MSELGRYGRKIQMIIGEANGDPQKDWHMLDRLVKMARKAIDAGETIPDFAMEYLDVDPPDTSPETENASEE